MHAYNCPHPSHLQCLCIIIMIPVFDRVKPGFTLKEVMRKRQLPHMYHQVGMYTTHIQLHNNTLLLLTVLHMYHQVGMDTTHTLSGPQPHNNTLLLLTVLLQHPHQASLKTKTKPIRKGNRAQKRSESETDTQEWNILDVTF